MKRCLKFLVFVSVAAIFCSTVTFIALKRQQSRFYTDAQAYRRETQASPDPTQMILQLPVATQVPAINMTHKTTTLCLIEKGVLGDGLGVYKRGESFSHATCEEYRRVIVDANVEIGVKSDMTGVLPSICWLMDQCSK